MFTEKPTTVRLRTARGLTVACVSATLAFFAFAGSASAASYTYCNGCTIYSNGIVLAAQWKYITLNYVHRLSGPGSGVTIGAIAKYADNGQWGNWAYSTSTEVTHGYNGTRRAWGAAGNFGAGNYGFNAHVNY